MTMPFSQPAAFAAARHKYACEKFIFHSILLKNIIIYVLYITLLFAEL